MEIILLAVGIFIVIIGVTVVLLFKKTNDAGDFPSNNLEIKPKQQAKFGHLEKIEFPEKNKLDPSKPSLSEADKAEVRRLVVAGKSVKAIKFVCNQTGLGLSEAKNYVLSIEESAKFGNIMSISDISSVHVDETIVLTQADKAILKQLLEDDKSVQAIKFLRDKTGIDLLNAKVYVDQLREQRIQSESYEENSALSKEELEDVLQLIENKKLVQAIKVVRDKTGCGLTEAKNFVDDLRDQKG
ncbi:hypothetical protein Hs30E_20770 [Lactococcus hodotermopsidis]|uniref:Ribosomal protein L7/L12 C-terminal domain-containing protein n=1 Tax=Pseudolactococcus hodotermopsidis TaxID=2709157 RepID=A0A6A0BGT1_9LACT|nr:hypothetical protein [Lactococcus hodotermopsidis]GFH43481.1 hypothetical protein Hs30E_20770 [Lactococcus hodotermopsidis]